MFMHPLHTQTNMWSPQNLLKLSFGVLMQETSCFRNVCWWFQPVSLVGCVSGYFTHGFVTRRLAIYRNTHSLSGLCQNSITTCFYLLFSMAISLDKKQLELLNLLHVVGRGRRMLSYGCHGNNWGHWGGWLHHQVGGAGHRVWLRGHMWVMGRRHAHAIGHLGFRLVLAEKGQTT